MTASGAIVTCERCGRRNRVPASRPGIPRCGQCHAPLPWIANANDDTFGEVVEASTIPVLVDFWAPWCGPCKVISPALERLAHRYAGRVKLVNVNVDEAPRVAQRFDVLGIPTLMTMNHRQVVSRRTGAAPEDALREWLEQSLDAPVGAG
jgi:thioredoxin 2